MSLRVSLIVLTYNGIDLTMQCLDSLRHQDYPNCHILVVDNASQDNTVETIRAAYPEVELIATGKNLGYAAGNNVGMRAALKQGAGALFLINNDTRLEPGCVSALVKTLAANPRIGIAGPMVLTWDEPGLISSAGGLIDWAHADAANEGAGQADRGQYPGRNVDFVNGCGLLVTAAAIERAGMLDPRFFMYWEEVDLCQRVKAAGFDVWFDRTAHMRHKATLETADLGPTTLYYVTRNRLLFFGRHGPTHLRPLALARAMHGALRGIARHRQAGRLAHARATQLALVHAGLRRWGYADPKLWLSALPGSEPRSGYARGTAS